MRNETRQNAVIGNVSIHDEFMSIVYIHERIKRRESRSPTLQSQRYPNYGNQQDCQYAGDAF
jgi:hypothetical protein